MAPHHLISALYGRLHRALVQQRATEIGVSFPGHDNAKPSLGEHLRLHGPQDALQALMATAWLQGLRDHLRTGEITAAPDGTMHRVVSRVQAKSNVERLRRRAMSRHGLDAAKAAERIPAAVERRLQLPFVTLGSRSTGQASFPLFIRHEDLTNAAVKGGFSSYGLSQGGTVPWF